MFSTNRYRTVILVALAVLVSTLSITGCEDQLLTQTPRGKLTDPSFFEKPEHAVQATNATYSILRDFNVHSFPWIGMTDITSDDADKGSTPSDNAEMLALDNFTFSSSNGLIEGPWDSYYQGIFRANLAINGIPNIEGMDENMSQRLIGENKFLRAYFYFFLVRAYGGVPLLLENLDASDSFQVPRSSKEEIYSQIEKDLTEAISALPLKSEYAASDLGRATKGAAQALLAKVHLFQDEYEDAGQMANAVINSGEYSLYPDYQGIFSEAGENSSGSIFEVQAVALEEGGGGTPYSVVQGVRGTPNLGWGFNNPSDDLLQAYEAGDPRMESTVMFVYETLPSDENVVHDNLNMFDERYNQKSFIPVDNPGGNFNGGSNIRRIRYSDILLVAAEAAYQNGEEERARELANQVRERARGNYSATLGIQAEALSSLAADSLGVSDATGSPVVRYVTSGSPAAEAGITSFNFGIAEQNENVYLFNNVDIIESINGNSMNSMQDYRDFRESLSAGQTAVVVIQRITESYNESSGQVERSSQTVQATVTAEELLPDITASGDALLDAVWHERRVELAMEQHRFFDLRRQDRAGEVLRAVGKDFQDGKHELFPIPQAEVDLSGLEQNPGYSN